MIDLGATSIWEQYLPTEKGAEHYAMYGKKYGRSLCHAWGGGPIYLLGRFAAGVYPTDVAYKTFTVEPKREIYKNFDATVPLPDGNTITVHLDAHTCRVKATRCGGTLIMGGKKYKIDPSREFTLSF